MNLKDFSGCVPTRLRRYAGPIGLMAIFLGLLAAPMFSPTTAAQVQPPHKNWLVAVQRNQTAQLHSGLAAQIRAGAVDARAVDGKTALMAAAAAGDPVLLGHLIDGGADPAAVNYKGASGLIYAAWSGNTEVLQKLIDARVPLEQAASNGWTAMTMASAKGRVASVRLLLRVGAQVDPPDVYGWTPLMRACNLERDAVARVLIDEGRASLTRINASGKTALHLAAATGNRGLYEMLVRRGADPETADSMGLTAKAILEAVLKGR
ncbi:MAG: ankyrin repeat domain-containing protein [Burkholderiaceae bacterium]